MKRWKEEKAGTLSVHKKVSIPVSVTRLMILKQKSQVNMILPVVMIQRDNLFNDPLYFSDFSSSDTSPASLKKGSGTGSMMDRLRSPSTMRKLSFKMKKLPELRRKLSLRSSSCAQHQVNTDCKDESTNKNEGSSLALLNQNVLSRYHLDSSTPSARPLSRSSRGRSVCKGGEY